MQLTPICNYSTVKIGEIWENKAMPASNGIASIGELLVEFVCADKGGHHRRLAPIAVPCERRPRIFIDQAATLRLPPHFCGAVGDDASVRYLDRLRRTPLHQLDAMVRAYPWRPL